MSVFQEWRILVVKLMWPQLFLDDWMVGDDKDAVFR